MGKNVMKSSKFKKKYKAIIFDVDGTLIPNKQDGIPTKKVLAALKKAALKIKTGVCSARPYFELKRVLQITPLSGPFIAGAQLYGEKHNLLWERTMDKTEAKKLGELARKLNAKMYFQNDKKEVIAGQEDQLDKILGCYISGMFPKDADKFIKEAHFLRSSVLHKVTSWKNGRITLSGYHVSATKLHALSELIKYLKIKNTDVIVVGDSYNDFPLFMAGGLRIAMGNAVDELKEIADYIAPSVQEDGAAHVIEKFVL
jgi:HAD superfamily hydrolase (TIGR01484 family)